MHQHSQIQCTPLTDLTSMLTFTKKFSPFSHFLCLVPEGISGGFTGGTRGARALTLVLGQIEA